MFFCPKRFILANSENLAEMMQTAALHQAHEILVHVSRESSDKPTQMSCLTGTFTFGTHKEERR